MDGWDSGDAYEAYMGRWSRPVAGRFVEWLHVPAGGVWLDVGCGTGALTAAVCDDAAPLAATGVDASPAYVAHAADRSTAPAADFLVAGASSLPFPDDVFDVVVSGLCLLYTSDAADERVRV